METNIKSIIDIKGKCQSVVKWRLTDCCNYRCSYCIRYAWSRKPQDLDMLEEDNRLAMKLIPEIARIIKDMPGKVKLDLIGGEVSLLSLENILEGIFKITGDKLYRVNLTTNMCKSAEYYTNLCDLVHSFGAELGITCSWHPEFCSFENFFEKFSQIKSPTNQKGIRAECVSRLDNQEDIKKFIDFCESKGFSYFVERDLNVPEGLKKELLIGSSKKKSDRYKIVTEDGQELFFKTRNEVIAGETLGYRNFALCNDYYCTRDYDYVYIEKDIHMGRIGDSNCKQKESIYDFKPLEEPKICIKPCCTLCGHMSLSKDLDDIKIKE